MTTFSKGYISRRTAPQAGRKPVAAAADRRPLHMLGNHDLGAALQAMGRGGAPIASAQPLCVGAAGTPHEREADRAARAETPPAPLFGLGHLRAPAPLRASPWRTALQQHLGAGEPLDAASRSRLQGAMPVDLGAVRLHRDAAAQRSSEALGAHAWTLGTDVFLAAGAPPLHSPAGRSLLAHELAHVVQQSHAQAGTLGLSPAPYQVQRQPAPATTPAATTPSFSVNQATYLSLINQALVPLAGRFVQNETLAATVEPILQAMLASVTWKDAQGASHGGGPIQHTLASGVTLNLQLVLNDAPNSKAAGEFHSSGSTGGVMEIFIQRNATAEDLAETLYHEAMHLVSWLVNRTPPALALRAAGRSGPTGAAATLDLARSTQAIASVRLWLDTLAQSVNTRRAAGARIGAADIDRTSRWLVEEINVRVETEVFRLASMVQTMLATRGPQVIVNPSANWTMNAATLDDYVFEFSRVFLPADRAGLTAADRQALATLLQILEGLFRSRVNRRFNPSPYMVGRALPRARVQIPLAPLVPPPFRPLPLP